MTEQRAEIRTFEQRYRELDASGAAVLRTIIELSVLLLKAQTPPEPPPQESPRDT